MTADIVLAKKRAEEAHEKLAGFQKDFHDDKGVIWKDIKSKVSMKVFLSCIGVIAGALLGIFGYLIVIYSNTSVANSEISNIKTMISEIKSSQKGGDHP